tara:strand:+ start:563 stop:802 length:240 start_codon:yes stop_codon:yes gene_type:complete
MTDKKYNNIADVSTSNLYKMLDDVRYQDSDSQSMIKAEISFRTNETFINQMFTNAINVNAINNLSDEQVNQVADILGVK